jgi:glycerol-3-phosphate dehydrogenase (NAD(P)+)
VKIAVLGAGSWGTTVASLLAERAQTTLWAREPEVSEAITAVHENPVFLPGVRLSASLSSHSSLPAVLAEAEAVIMAVPSRFFRGVLEEAAVSIPPDAPVLSLTKGIEGGSLLRMTEVALQVLSGHQPDLIGVLSGPNIAREIAAGQPAATVVAFPDPDPAKWFQDLLMTDRFRVYTHTDTIGCELGGALKNVIALAAGMAVGLGYGANSQAALMTRGLAELTRLGVVLGAEPLTLLGLAGVGDLFATCTGAGSRNRTVGVELGKGRSLVDILAGMQMVAEGIETARPALDLAARNGVEAPIVQEVTAVLQGTRRPVEALTVLMRRGAKSELYGIASPTGATT